jgi:hypothetical protein
MAPLRTVFQDGIIKRDGLRDAGALCAAPDLMHRVLVHQAERAVPSGHDGVRQRIRRSRPSAATDTQMWSARARVRAPRGVMCVRT